MAGSTLSKTMRAVVYGPTAGTFPLVALPVPVPSSSQLRVRVHAAALNPLDYKLPSMMPFFLRWTLRGKGVSFDFSGIVDAVGDKVKGFSVGDRVFGFTGGGALAEYVVADPKEVVVLPTSVSFADAASLPGSGLTSLQALRRGGAGSDTKLLIFGASGGCGSLGVQFAKALGVGKVVGVCSAANAEAVKALGCDVVVPYDGGDQALEQGLAAAGPFDWAYDCVTSPEDRNYEPLSRKVLKPGGLHLALNGKASDFMRMFCGLPQRQDYLLYLMHRDPADLAEIIGWVDAGVVKPLLAQQCAFNEAGIADAIALISSRRAKGKVVVNVVG